MSRRIRLGSVYVCCHSRTGVWNERKWRPGNGAAWQIDQHHQTEAQEMGSRVGLMSKREISVVLVHFITLWKTPTHTHTLIWWKCPPTSRSTHFNVCQWSANVTRKSDHHASGEALWMVCLCLLVAYFPIGPDEFKQNTSLWSWWLGSCPSHREHAQWLHWRPIERARLSMQSDTSNPWTESSSAIDLESRRGRPMRSGRSGRTPCANETVAWGRNNTHTHTRDKSKCKEIGPRLLICFAYNTRDRKKPRPGFLLNRAIRSGQLFLTIKWSPSLSSLQMIIEIDMVRKKAIYLSWAEPTRARIGAPIGCK